jgi:NAD(P)-dependent dehydrogenase (short-subunit alcohol dehydrogenase family)
MPSAYWDESLAERYSRFHYDFPEKPLAGRTVIVAGGTGGLGSALVALLAGEGARVIVGYRSNRERAEKLQQAIEGQFRSKLHFVAGDILDPAVRKTYLDAVKAAGEPLAGAAIFPGEPARVPFESLSRDSITASLESNYIGPVLLARDLGAKMEGSEEGSGAGGSLVLLATMQAVAPFASSLAYAGPKAALVHSARILALQWNRVSVNVVAPGATVAGMAESSVSAGKYDRHISNGAISRFGRPEDIARAVRFFLEPGQYATGQVLVVDGGLTIRRDRG